MNWTVSNHKGIILWMSHWLPTDDKEVLGAQKLMIWACSAPGAPVLFVSITGNQTSTGYCGLLKKNLLAYDDNDLINNWILQKDERYSHIAGNTND